MKVKETSSRRRFFRAAGTALTAPLAVVAAEASPAPSTREDTAIRTRLDDIEAIRRAHRELAQQIELGRLDSSVQRLAAADVVESLAAVKRLAASGFGDSDRIEIAADGRSASADLHVRVETERAIDAIGTVAEMARAQGHGFVRESNDAVLSSSLVKHGGSWRFVRAVIRPA
jgi:hypothetical protein